MVVTADVTHDPMSGLHVLLPVVETPKLLSHLDQALNRHSMSVIALTFQSEMLPYSARVGRGLQVGLVGSLRRRAGREYCYKGCEDELHCLLRKGKGRGQAAR